MKIVILGLAYPYRGGISDSTESLYNALIEKGHQVELINFSKLYPDFLFPGKTQFHNGFDESLKPKHKRLINSINPFSWIKTAIEIRKQKPDLILVRFWLPFLSPALGTVLRLSGKKAKKFMICDNLYPHEKRFGDKFLIDYIIDSVDACMALSKNIMEEFKEVSNKKVDFFPHPINDDLGEKLSKEIACKELGLDSKQNYFLHFGIIRKYKGLDLALKGFSLYKKNGGDAKLIVAGEFYEDEKPYLDLIDELGIEKDVVLHNFFIPKSQVASYFSAADLLLQTYITASQSGVSQMAYHFDLPLLVSRVGGLPEMVNHLETGFVVETKPEEIANALRNFNQNLKTEFSRNIKKQKEQYSWMAFAEKFEKLYKTVLT